MPRPVPCLSPCNHRYCIVQYILSPHLPASTLKSKVERHGHKQRRAQDAGPPFVVVLGHSSAADGLAAVEVNHHGIAQRHDGQERKRPRRHKAGSTPLLGAKVEQRHGNGPNVNRVFQLQESAHLLLQQTEAKKTYPSKERPLGRKEHLGLYPYGHVNLLPLGRLESLRLDLSGAQ